MGEEHKIPLFVWISAGLVMFFLLFPIFIIIPISFSAAHYLQFPPETLSLQWYDKYFSDSAWLEATFLSFRVGLVVMVLATTIGSMAAFVIVRSTYRGITLLHALMLAPLVVPLIITAIAIYFVLAEFKLVGTEAGLIVAHTVVTMPLAVVIVVASLRGFDSTLELAAVGLGATPAYAVRRVTLPILAPGIATAAMLTFLTSFDEIVIAIFLSGTGAVTLPKKMWEGVWLEITPTIAAASSILIVLTVLIFVCVDRLQRRSEAMKGSAKGDHSLA